MSRNSVFLAAMLLLLSAIEIDTAQADDSDHDIARRLLEDGRILSLADIVAKVSQDVPGEMLEVELESDDGSYRYELKILRPDGRVQEVEVDAASGAIVKIEDDD